MAPQTATHNSHDVVDDRRVLTLVLIAITGLVLYVCYGILRPFFPVLSWSIALAVVTYPVYRFICKRISDNPSVAAGLTVGLLAIGIVGPFSFFIHRIVEEGRENIQWISTQLNEGRWQEVVSQHPRIASGYAWLEENLNMRAAIGEAANRVGQFAPTLFTGSIWSIIQLALILFTIFFLYRDRRMVVDTARRLVPLSADETNELFVRVRDTIHATIYGTMVVSIAKGILGGLIFFILGMEAPILWGFVMALAALIPYVGATIVWGPAAIYLAVQGSYVKAGIMAFWGAIVVGLIDNILYPHLVGNRLRFHTLAVFFFVLGGVAFFGVEGLILGPVTLAVADALLEIWRRRIGEDTRRDSHGQPAPS